MSYYCCCCFLLPPLLGSTPNVVAELAEQTHSRHVGSDYSLGQLAQPTDRLSRDSILSPRVRVTRLRSSRTGISSHQLWQIKHFLHSNGNTAWHACSCLR